MFPWLSLLTIEEQYVGRGNLELWFVTQSVYDPNILDLLLTIEEQYVGRGNLELWFVTQSVYDPNILDLLYMIQM
jgi:hypothetical protein